VWGWLAWVAVVLAVWVIVAALVGVLLGRMVRQRDRQVPQEGAEVPFPVSRAPAEGPSAPERRSRPRT
jgi:hypothetical protein